MASREQEQEAGRWRGVLPPRAPQPVGSRVWGGSSSESATAIGEQDLGVLPPWYFEKRPRADGPMCSCHSPNQNNFIYNAHIHT